VTFRCSEDARCFFTENCLSNGHRVDNRVGGWLASDNAKEA
jgi:hypothetical protein